ncbi:hypothetical protein QBC44DRAFT_371812 [Cladorrhinum sp. PSN332]|nr:hypothetical protein QBC44DRAFT_371812 [Cladorrhinum sp. PSN332]
MDSSAPNENLPASPNIAGPSADAPKSPKVDKWLYYTPDIFKYMQHELEDKPPPTQPEPTSESNAETWPDSCIICTTNLPRPNLCSLHPGQCGALACASCLITHINASLNIYTPTPFPPQVPCLCSSSTSQNLLVPDIFSPVSLFLGVDWAEFYARAHRGRVHLINHHLSTTVAATTNSQGGSLTQTREQTDDVAKELEAVQALALLAKDQHWKRCPGCGHVIEHSGGCHDMFCVCGTRFCYFCGRRTLWNQDCGCLYEDVGEVQGQL